jgi:hypothetical protein
VGLGHRTRQALADPLLLGSVFSLPIAAPPSVPLKPIPKC